MTPEQAQTLRDAQWMPASTPTEWPIIRERILTMIRTHPRSLQETPGPSELGTTCLRCLAHRLHNDPKRDTAETQWATTVGTGGHLLLQEWFDRHAEEGEAMRWEAEKPVHTATLQHAGKAVSIGGHIDLWDSMTDTTIDWKFTGQQTIRDATRNGPSQTYRIQASLYGIGIRNETGSYPRSSCILYLPRGGTNLDGGYAWQADYDPKPGQWALRRAQLMYCLLDEADAAGCAAAAIRALPADPAHCFTGRSSAYPAPVRARPKPTLAQLIAGEPADKGGNADPDGERDAIPANVATLASLLQAAYEPTNNSNK